MEGVLALSFVALGLGLNLVMRLCQRTLLRSARPDAPGTLPPVSILKPLCGLDQDLAGNLASHFAADYPEYEVILGARDADDPAIPVAEAVAARYPDVPSEVVVDDREVGPNPKVANLANLYRRSRHEVILTVDSNIALRPDAVRRLVSHLSEPGVGLVSAPFRGTGGEGFGAALEAFHLNTFVMGGVAAMDRALRLTCVTGKVMMMRRSDLEEIGGFTALSRYLAEDQVCGLSIKKLGRRVVLSGEAVDNVLGRVPFRGFVARQLRWARIRRRLTKRGYLGEALLNPVWPSVVVAAALPGPLTLAAAAAALVGLSVLGLAAERLLRIRRNPLVYPVLELTRSFVMGGIWFVPWFSTRVRWRGNEFRVRPGTVLEPAVRSKEP